MADSFVAGRVVDARGQPVAKITVRASQNPSPDSRQTVTTDADGRFRLDKLMPRSPRVLLEAKSATGRLLGDSVVATPPAEDVLIRLFLATTRPAQTAPAGR